MLHIQRTDRDKTYCGRQVHELNVVKARPSEIADRPDFETVARKITLTEVCKTCWRGFCVDCGMEKDVAPARTIDGMIEQLYKILGQDVRLCYCVGGLWAVDVPALSQPPIEGRTRREALRTAIEAVKRGLF